MIKKALFLSFSFLTIATYAPAQENSDDFYQDILIGDEIKQQIKQDEEKEKLLQQGHNAQLSAKGLLQQKAKPIEIDTPQPTKHIFRSREQTKTAPQSQAAKQQENLKAQNLDSAPFGLLWGATINNIKNLGVILTQSEEKDYVNVFSATQLPKETKEFRQITLVFGEENELWRITGIGNFINDDASASKVLKEYRKYYRLLSKKYGNAKEFFTPKTNIVTKQVYKNGQNQTVEESVPEPIGNPNFLSQLQNGEAVLYSTFQGNNIGAALAINVDGEGKSYIIIDYKNLKILQSREDATLDIL